MGFVPGAVSSDVLGNSMAVRLAHFKGKTIAHPRLVATHRAVCQAIREPAGASVIVVVGPSGVGKTTLRRRVEEQLTQELKSTLDADPGRLPIVSVEAIAGESADFNWRDFYMRLLTAMDEPLIDRKIDYETRGLGRNPDGRIVVRSRAAAPDLRRAVEHCVRHRRPAAILVDEAQHLKKIASGRQLLDQLDTIKSLASVTGVVHVLIGTYELLVLTNLSAQLNRRSIDIHFPRYRPDTADDVDAFQNVLGTFQQHLPFSENLDLVERWAQCYEGAVGCVGVLKDWLTRAVAGALEGGETRLTLARLEQHAESRVKLLQMAREIKEGEERLTETRATAEDLHTVLGLNPKDVRPGGTAAGQPLLATPAATQPRRRRVGERKPTRDPVGPSERAG